jgi:hypothetical protein
MKFPFKKHYLTPEEVCKAIDSFVNGTGGAWDWDDFLYAPIKDPYLKELRDKCFNLRDEYPSRNPNEYCNEVGLKILEELLSDLRTKMAKDAQTGRRPTERG